jgi:hypothetical protein
LRARRKEEIRKGAAERGREERKTGNGEERKGRESLNTGSRGKKPRSGDGERKEKWEGGQEVGKQRHLLACQ